MVMSVNNGFVENIPCQLKISSRHHNLAQRKKNNIRRTELSLGGGGGLVQ